MIDEFLLWLKTNQFASGGLLMGALTLFYRNGLGYFYRVYNMIKNRVITNLVLRSDDNAEAYYALLDWSIAELKKKNKTILTYGFLPRHILASFFTEDDLNKETVELVPTTGTWILKLDIGYILLQMSVSTKQVNNSSTEIRIISITTFAKNKTRLMTKLNNLINNFKQRQNHTSLGYFRHDYFCMLGDIPTPSNKDTIVLDESLVNKIIFDLQTFYDSKDKYQKLGIPYKKVIILAGPPGNGKTSLIKMLSHYFNKPIISIQKQNLESTMNLAEAYSGRSSPILFCEDMDTSSEELPKDKEEEDVNVVTITPKTPLSSILNTLDGIFTPSGMILIITANKIDKFPKAFLRPGRIDHIYILENASQDQIQRLFLKFHPNEIENSLTFSKLLPDKVISMARLQQYFLQYESVTELMAHTNELIESTSEDT